MSTHRYFLKTIRLGFRRWREDDVDLAVGLWGDFEVTKLFDGRGALSRKQVKERLFQEIANEQKFAVQYWPFFLLESGEHVGACGLRPYEIDRNIFEIGFHLRSEYWRQGYATEAARRVIRYAFESLQIRTLFAGHHPDNHVSDHLLKKLGFRFTHREYYAPTGRNHPSYLMTAEEYAPARGPS